VTIASALNVNCILRPKAVLDPGQDEGWSSSPSTHALDSPG